MESYLCCIGSVPTNQSQLFLRILNYFPLYTGVFDVDSGEATHCWRPLDPPLMISTRARVAAFMSCITVAFFSDRFHSYMVFFFGTMDHLFSQRDTGCTCVVLIEGTTKKNKHLNPCADGCSATAFYRTECCTQLTPCLIVKLASA